MADDDIRRALAAAAPDAAPVAFDGVARAAVRRRRRLTVSAAVAVLLVIGGVASAVGLGGGSAPRRIGPAGTGSPTPQPSSPPAATVAPPCTANDLTVAEGAPGLWTAHAETHYVVNNSSARGCSVLRTPTVTFTAARGELQIPRKQTRSARRPGTARLVVIPPNSAAVFGVVSTNQAAFTPPQCPASLTGGDEAFTLSSRARLSLPFSGPVCTTPGRTPYVDPMALVRPGMTTGVLGCDQLRIVVAGLGSGMTGEIMEPLRLTNTSRTTCTLRGYPDVVAVDRGGQPVHFAVTHGGAYTTHARPRTVLLDPGASAYVLVAKYRCDLGDRVRVHALRLRLQDGPTLTADLGRFPDFSSCRGRGGAGGDTLDVSPYEPTSAATTRSP